MHHAVSEAQYVEMKATFMGFPSTTRTLRRTLIVATGILALFWSYTMLLGIILLVIVVFLLSMPRFLPGSITRTYATLSHLHQPATHGADEQQVWFRARDFAFEARLA